MTYGSPKQSPSWAQFKPKLKNTPAFLPQRQDNDLLVICHFHFFTSAALGGWSCKTMTQRSEKKSQVILTSWKRSASIFKQWGNYFPIWLISGHISLHSSNIHFHLDCLSPCYSKLKDFFSTVVSWLCLCQLYSACISKRALHRRM